MRAETIFLVLMALAAFMMLGALINTGEHQATQVSTIVFSKHRRFILK